MPAAYARLFRGAREELASHSGWDRGALELARELARALDAPLFAAATSRLVVDLNRSLGHRGLFSERTRRLGPEEREHLLARCYHPHRKRVLAAIEARVRRGGIVVHVAVHSFAPRLRGVTRHADIGLLYDPARRREAAFARAWKRTIGREDPDLRVLANRPYRGTSDGLTTSLRRRLPACNYLGLELEVNQTLVLGPRTRWKAVRAALSRSLASALAQRREWIQAT